MRQLRAVACGSGRQSTSVMLGHACKMLAVMYLQQGPPIEENESTTHRTLRTHKTRSLSHCSCGHAYSTCLWLFEPGPCSMCSMRSMCGGFIFRSQGPLQKVCHYPARMSGHNCLPGQQTVCFPGGRPHEHNKEVPRMDGSAGRTHTIRTAHTFSLTPQLLLLSVDFVPHPLWVKHWAPVGAPPHWWRGFPLVVSTN
jgi:hypothetical protein